MKPNVDMNKVAKGLRAKRKGKVSAAGGYFGALQLVAEVEARFRVPEGGGRATDPNWTERRQVPLAPRTLRRLEQLSSKLSKTGDVNVGPLQLAGLLLEKAAEGITDQDVAELAKGRRG